MTNGRPHEAKCLVGGTYRLLSPQRKQRSLPRKCEDCYGTRIEVVRTTLSCLEKCRGGYGGSDLNADLAGLRPIANDSPSTCGAD